MPERNLYLKLEDARKEFQLAYGRIDASKRAEVFSDVVRLLNLEIRERKLDERCDRLEKLSNKIDSIYRKSLNIEIFATMAGLTASFGAMVTMSSAINTKTATLCTPISSTSCWFDASAYAMLGAVVIMIGAFVVNSLTYNWDIRINKSICKRENTDNKINALAASLRNKIGDEATGVFEELQNMDFEELLGIKKELKKSLKSWLRR